MLYNRVDYVAKQKDLMLHRGTRKERGISNAWLANSPKKIYAVFLLTMSAHLYNGRTMSNASQGLVGGSVRKVRVNKEQILDLQKSHCCKQRLGF